MDLTEAFAPNQTGTGGTITDEKTTDYFDFVVSPPPHCTGTDGSVDEDSFLNRTNCRTTISYLGDNRLHDGGFIKETNNNTLTALPPVSTITGSLGHIANNLNRITRSHSDSDGLANTDPVVMDHTTQDCDYWVINDTKEQTCNILLEDLNKYCWTTQINSPNNHHPGLLIQRSRDPPHNNHRDCSGNDRQNTDGAIYTLTVLNNEANSMDGLECCKSPTASTENDSWTLRPNHLDLDAILNMESSVSIGGSTDGTVTDGTSAVTEREQEQHVVVTRNGTTINRYTAVPTSQYATDEQTSFGQVTIKSEPGDNNNDWKLSNRNNSQETESAAESLLRNALQGKLYSTAVTSTALTGTTRILTNTQTGTPQPGQGEAMHGCAEELLLSHLEVDVAYRTAEYEKLKNIANEVVESYCNLEPVCNVSATTVMYTLDPANGSLGTITLPADLAEVGTVTVVTTSSSQQDVLNQETRHPDPQQQPARNHQCRSPTSHQLQMSGNLGNGRAIGSKPAKKYARRLNRNSTTGSGNSTGGVSGSAVGSNSSSSGASVASSAGSPGNGGVVPQRKERSLHYCSICSKGFKDKYSVNVHIRTHTGEKPFACSLCGKSFRQKAHLAKHYQTHVTQKPNVAAAAQAATVTVSSTTSICNNGSASSSSSGSRKSASSPTVVQQKNSTLDSSVIAADCNSTS